MHCWRLLRAQKGGSVVKCRVFTRIVTKMYTMKYYDLWFTPLGMGASGLRSFLDLVHLRLLGVHSLPWRSDTLHGVCATRSAEFPSARRLDPREERGFGSRTGP